MRYTTVRPCSFVYMQLLSLNFRSKVKDLVVYAIVKLIQQSDIEQNTFPMHNHSNPALH